MVSSTYKAHSSLNSSSRGPCPLAFRGSCSHLGHVNSCKHTCIQLCHHDKGRAWSITAFGLCSKDMVEEGVLPNITACERGLSLLMTYPLLARFGWPPGGHIPISGLPENRLLKLCESLANTCGEEPGKCDQPAPL